MLHQLSAVFQNHQDKLSGKLYLACSGGRDSQSLVWACKLLFDKGILLNLPTLLHVHHGWQVANDDWAKLVKNWANTHGFNCQILNINLPKNNETTARAMRYDALMSVMNDGDVLLLAHHANDQAETLLMRLINGAGVQGLSAMKIWQSKSTQNKTIRLFRPMLAITRDEISQFARQYELPYVDDPTNVNDNHLRGKLRNHIMPVLTKINPKAIENIARSSQLLTQASDIIDVSVSENLALAKNTTLSQEPFCWVLDINKVIGLPPAMQSALVHAWLCHSEPLPPTHRLVQDVLNLMTRQDSNHQARLFWQGFYGQVICRYQGQIYRYRSDAWACLLAKNSKITIQNGCVILKKTDDLSIIWQIPSQWSCQNLSIEKLTHQTIVPFAHRALHGKKLMQTLGIPAWLRDCLWLIYVDDKPVSLLGVGRMWRLDDRQAVVGGAIFT